MKLRQSRLAIAQASAAGVLFCVLVTLTGCTAPSWSALSPKDVAAASPAVPGLEKALGNAAAAVQDGQVGIAIYDRQRDQMIGTYNADQGFATESVVKILIGLDTLDRDGNTAQVEEMISRSDDDTADTLWVQGGENAILTRMISKIGLTETVPPANPGRWGDTVMTANDLVNTYRYILDRAPASERNSIVTAMRGATKHGADGFNQYFGIPDAVGNNRQWAVKQGWACCAPDRVLNTTGLLDNNDRYIVIVLTSHNASTTYPTDSAEITAAVRALLPALPQ